MIDRRNNNYVIEISDTLTQVELWSDKRLPFEPKGYLLEMRNNLRKAISSLTESSYLYCLYSSTVRGFFDIENVLLYNVGGSPFKYLTGKGLCFERSFSEPPSIQEVTLSNTNHYHSYNTSETVPSSRYWKRTTKVAEFHDCKIPRLKGDLKPDSIWYAMKQGNIKTFANSNLGDFLEIKLTISVPYFGEVKLVSVIKPLLDGIISSFHYHDGSNSEIILERLSDRLLLPREKISNHIYNANQSFLGKRDLVRPFGKGHQWNPEDARLVRVLIEIDSDNVNNNNWKVSGEVYNVSNELKGSISDRIIK